MTQELALRKLIVIIIIAIVLAIMIFFLARINIVDWLKNLFPGFGSEKLSIAMLKKW